MRHAVLFWLALHWLTCSNCVQGSEQLETSRARTFATKVQDILVNKVARSFTALDVFEKKYGEINMQTVSINSTQIVKEKVAALHKILQNTEEKVKRVAKKVESLRQDQVPDMITNEELTFYKEESVDGNVLNGTTGTDAASEMPEKLYYRNAKCGCGYQLPEDILDSACVQSQAGYKVNRQFGNLGVSYEMSSVHIPTEIYNQDPEVLKDIYLSRGIDEILKEEVCMNNSFSHLNKWVYYTTHRGVMRFFPDRIWTDECERPDIYDSRVSPWYVQSVSSPKDVIVLIDNSGSVEGLTLNLFFRSVRHFLDTLGVNDFVNIVLFNEEADYINDTCTGLLQATPRNKQILQRWMENIKTKNRSSFEAGFDLALKTLNATSGPESMHANCNPMVVLFTDGGATYPTDALNKWNPNGNKRVFTFAVGKNFYEKESTKDIACGNRGNFNSIPSYTATKSEVQGYLVKISEPLASQTQYVKWTLPYGDQLGLGMVVSASVPVYELVVGEEEEEEETMRSVGIVGTDLALDDLKKVAIDPEMGPDYYPFVVDNNGFAMFHPNAKENTHGEVMTIDLMDLEQSDIVEIRKDIINGNSGSQKFDKSVIFDTRYSSTSQYAYTYSPIGTVGLRFGLGIHSSKLKYFDTQSALEDNFPDLAMEKLVKKSSDTISLLFSSPCKDTAQVGYNPCELEEKDNITDVASYEDGVTLEQFAGMLCEKSPQLYSSLLLHAHVSDDVASSNWDRNSTIKNGNGVLAIYAALETPSFIRVKFMNSSEQTSGRLPDMNSEIREEITGILSHPRKKTHVRRAFHKPEWTIYSYAKAPVLTEPAVSAATPSFAATDDTTFGPYSTTPSMNTGAFIQKTTLARGYIVSSRVVRPSADEPNIFPVVTGLVLDPETFQQNVFNLAYKCNGNSNCSLDEEERLCADPEKTSCLVLDDGGYLILSNQEYLSGKMDQFFGMVDGEFMRSLVKHRVYSESYVYDYQAICEKSTTDKSAGTLRYFVPTISDIISFGWWFSSAARFFIYSSFNTMTVALWSIFHTSSSHASTLTGFETLIQPEHCILRTPIYGFGANSQQIYGTFGTETCERSFTSVRLAGTNLLLVVSMKQDCSTISIFSNKPEDVTVDEICPNKTMRYRRHPEERCFDARTMRESLDSSCSTGSTLLPSRLMLFGFALVLYLLVFNPAE